ncbi:MAG: CHAD domain-containing protein [Alphaproteobacteria bacterium]|nr:CHAD domain-containing protein [Alphaproteobacteria bacterium]
MNHPNNGTLRVVAGARNSRHRAVRANPVRLTGDMRAADGFRIIVMECAAHIAANIGAVRNGEREGVHQMRVGLRRMNVALAMLKMMPGSPGVKRLRKRTRALAAGLGQARDLDVFVDEILAGMPADDAAALETLRVETDRLHRDAWAVAKMAVEDRALDAFLDEIAALAEELSAPGQAKDRKVLSQAAPDVLDRLLSRARKRGRRIVNGDDRALHRLRIALKKLRYAVEFFESLYPHKSGRRYLKRLKAMQDLLGRVNDAAAARATLKRVLDGADGDVAALRYAAGLVTGFHDARADGLRVDALKEWGAFSERKPFWR